MRDGGTQTSQASDSLLQRVRRWWHRSFASASCADSACPDHGDDPWTLYAGDGSDL